MMSTGPRLTFALALVVGALWAPATEAEGRGVIDAGTQATGSVERSVGSDSLQVHRDAERALMAYNRAQSDFHRREASRAIPSLEGPVPRFQRLLVWIDDSRLETIEILDRLAEVTPGSDFILGYRVGLRVELGLVAEARGVLSSCEGSAWWCSALDGLVEHNAGNTRSADAAFMEAVALMPEEGRCELFTDSLHLVSRDIRRAWERADCNELRGFWHQTWWLADPLHAFEGNDRRNEHMSRVVLMYLHHELLALDGLRCTPEHHRRVLEGGWPPWGTTGIPSSQVPVPWDDRGLRTVPMGGAFVHPLASVAGDWLVEAARQGERYRPTFGDLAPISHQTAFFLRDDSLLVVSSVDAPRGVAALGLALSRNENEAPRIERAPVSTGSAAGGATGWVQLEQHVARDRWLVSIEGLGAGVGGYRARFGHALPEPAASGLAVSDVVLFEWRDDLEAELDAVRSRFLGSEVVDRSEPVGVFWEVYGGETGEPLAISVTVQREDRGFLRRAGEALRMLRPHQPIPVRWEGVRSSDKIQGVHLFLDLRNVDPGRYTLEVGTAQGDGMPAVAHRAVEVR